MATTTAPMPYRVQLPARLASPEPTHATYVRRRVVVALALVSLVAVIGLTASQGLADRGGDPASTAAVGQPDPAGVLTSTYLVQPGDTLWSIAESRHAGGDLAGYVDALVSLNGGARIEVGQQLLLP